MMKRLLTLFLPAIAVALPVSAQISLSCVGGSYNAGILTCPIGGTVITPPIGTAPSSCSIIGAPTGVIAPGTPIAMSASCVTGSIVASCAWSTGATGCSITASPTVTTTYSVTASNAFGNGTASDTVLVTPPTVSACGPNDQIITVVWPPSGQVRPNTINFINQVIAFKITIPLTFSPVLNIKHIGFAHIIEVPGTAVTSRDVTVSKTACDFQSGKYLYADVGLGDTAPGVNFTVSNPAFSAVGADFNVNPGDTVYLNVRNMANGGVPSCPVGGTACNVLFDFATPNRY